MVFGVVWWSDSLTRSMLLPVLLPVGVGWFFFGRFRRAQVAPCAAKAPSVEEGPPKDLPPTALTSAGQG